MLHDVYLDAIKNRESKITGISDSDSKNKKIRTITSPKVFEETVSRPRKLARYKDSADKIEQMIFKSNTVRIEKVIYGSEALSGLVRCSCGCHSKTQLLNLKTATTTPFVNDGAQVGSWGWYHYLPTFEPNLVGTQLACNPLLDHSMHFMLSCPSKSIANEVHTLPVTRDDATYYGRVEFKILTHKCVKRHTDVS